MEDFVLTPGERALFAALRARGIKFMIIGLSAAVLEGAPVATQEHRPVVRRSGRRALGACSEGGILWASGGTFAGDDTSKRQHTHRHPINFAFDAAFRSLRQLFAPNKADGVSSVSPRAGGEHWVPAFTQFYPVSVNPARTRLAFTSGETAMETWVVERFLPRPR